MSLFSIVTEYNWPLEAPQYHIDHARYDSANCGAAGQVTLDLSDQLQRRIIKNMSAILLGSVNELV